jgi:hypothetical protein
MSKSIRNKSLSRFDPSQPPKIQRLFFIKAEEWLALGGGLFPEDSTFYQVRVPVFNS